MAAAATSTCPGRTRASGARRATRTSTASRPPSWPRREEIDASLRIQATENANALAGVDPARLARAARARSPLREARLARRWAITLWPTPPPPSRPGWAPREFEAFVERALFLDRDDPVAAWGELRDFQARLIDRLAPAQEIRIQAEGTDLTLNVDGPHLDQLRRQAQHARPARSSPARTSTPPRA